MIEQIIYFSAEESHDSAIHDLRAFAEIAADLAATVLRIDIDAYLQCFLSCLTDPEGDIEGLIREMLPGAIEGDIALAKIQVTQGTGQTFVQDRGNDITAQLLGNNASFLGDRIEGISVLVDAVLNDEILLQHFVKGFGKIQIQDVVILHHDVIDGNEIHRVIDVAHQVQNEDLDVVFAPDGG